MSAAPYLAINPMAKVPALVHGAAVVTETAAICAYLADAFPEAGLAPPLASPARAPYLRWLFFAAGPLEAAWTTATLGFEVPPEKSRMVGYGSFALVIDTLEHAVAKAPTLAGDAFSAADLYLSAQLAFGMRFGMIEKRPALRRLRGPRHEPPRRDPRARAGRRADPARRGLTRPWPSSTTSPAWRQSTGRSTRSAAPPPPRSPTTSPPPTATSSKPPPSWRWPPSAPRASTAPPAATAPASSRVADPVTLLLPDRRGNNRIDSLRNIVRDPRVGLMFLIPGIGNAMRINRRAPPRRRRDLARNLRRRRPRPPHRHGDPASRTSTSSAPAP